MMTGSCQRPKSSCRPELTVCSQAGMGRPSAEAVQGVSVAAAVCCCAMVEDCGSVRVNQVGADLEGQCGTARACCCGLRGTCASPPQQGQAIDSSRGSCALLAEAPLLSSSQQVPCNAGGSLAASSPAHHAACPCANVPGQQALHHAAGAAPLAKGSCTASWQGGYPRGAAFTSSRSPHLGSLAARPGELPTCHPLAACTTPGHRCPCQVSPNS